MYSGRHIALRPLQLSDLPLMTELANDVRVRSMIVGWDWPVSPDRQVEWFHTSLTSPTTKRMTVVDKATGDVIGLTGFWDIDWHNRKALTGVKLLPENGVKGAGTDVMMLLNAWGFREVGLNRIYGGFLPFNGASIRMAMEKSGWRIEGRERESVYVNGQWHDLIQAAVIRSDFEAHPDADEYARYVYPVETPSGPDIGPAVG